MQLTVQDLTCVRGGRTVFAGLNLRVAGGSGVELTGPNGAGKSSLLRMLAGLIPAASGKIRFEGGAADTPLGEQCHYIGHLSGVKRALTVEENLTFWAVYLGGGDAGRALATFGLESLSDIPAGLLSAGQARRLGLARLSLAHRPVWLLDEPSVSLDAASRKVLGRIIATHVEAGGIAVAATHAPLGVRFAQRLKLGGRRA